jgi:hypothetical protein
MEMELGAGRMSPEAKRLVTLLIALTAIIGSCTWIYLTQFRGPKHDLGLHTYIGKVLAEEAARLIGKKGRVVTISIETKGWPELETQLRSFNATLKKLGDYEVRAYEMETKDQPKYGVGTGLSGRRFVRTVNKNENADLFVSFVGAPNLSKEEVKEMTKKPRLIVESRSGDNLPGLFEAHLLEVAVVSRFEFPAPVQENPKTPEEWFTKRYQIVNAETARVLSKGD